MAVLAGKKMEQELDDAATAERWLVALDAVKAFESFVDPALVDKLVPRRPTFGSYDTEIRWLGAEKSFLERGQYAVQGSCSNVRTVLAHSVPTPLRRGVGTF